jgi:hypothetical protein
MREVLQERFVLIGSNGYIGSLLGMCPLIQEKVTGIPYFSNLTPNLLQNVIMINATGKTHFPLGLLDNAAIEYLEVLGGAINEFGSKIRHFVQISSSLLDEADIVETSPYLQSKLKIESLLIESSLKYDFKLSLIRLPSIWSKHLLKQNSLLVDLLNAEYPIEPTTLSASSRICHLASDKTLFDLLSLALYSETKILRAQKEGVWKTNSGETLALVNNQSETSALSPIQKELWDTFHHWKFHV